MPSPRRLALVAAAAASCVLLAGCSHDVAEPPSPYVPPAPSTSSPSATTEPSAVPLTLDPLEAHDLGAAWHDSVVPDDLGADWVDTCGHGTGIVVAQTDAKATAMLGPGDTLVLSRVATYRAGEVVDALAEAQTEFVDCPAHDVPGGRISVSTVSAPVGQQAVGAVVTRYDTGGLVVDQVGYWIARSGDASVEVYVHGTFDASSSADPMGDFSTDVLRTALAKASGQDYGPVPMPPLAGSGSGGSLTDPGAGDATEEPVPGTGGESGPGVITNGN